MARRQCKRYYNTGDGSWWYSTDDYELNVFMAGITFTLIVCNILSTIRMDDFIRRIGVWDYG